MKLVLIFLELTFSIPYKDYENDPWNENNVLLVSPENRASLNFPALVKGVKKGWETVTIHCSVNLNILGSNISGSLYLKTPWIAKTLMNLTTEAREYLALGGLSGLKLYHDILKPQKSIPKNYEISPKVGQYITNLGVNRPQAIAIVRGVEENGFVLIQGPPGSGKTKTILGLVGALQSTPTHIPIPGTHIPGTHILGTSAMTGSRSGVKKRLLICAPSNAAIDEIGRRLMKGISNLSGQPYFPKLVRIGKISSVHPDVLPISLV